MDPLYADLIGHIWGPLDEELLERLDRDEEVRRDSRSAVLRRATNLYLRQRRAREIAAAYRQAYGSGLDTIFIGTLSAAKMSEVCRALAIATGCS